jgi:hypothetical protein
MKIFIITRFIYYFLKIEETKVIINKTTKIFIKGIMKEKEKKSKNLK